MAAQLDTIVTLPINPPGNVNPYSKAQLRTVLIGWHRASADEHPAPFPGPVARGQLEAWVYDVRRRAQARGIPRQQWTNALLSWIPSATHGRSGFRDYLLGCMRAKRATGEWEGGRFWEWALFKYLFFEICADERVKKFFWMGVGAVGGVVALPLIGLPVLGAIGFTSGGVAAGSVATGIQSMFYGGATGGVFSVLQGIGARAAFPAAFNFVAGALGAKAVETATAYSRGESSTSDSETDLLGDIGDD